MGKVSRVRRMRSKASAASMPYGRHNKGMDTTNSSGDGVGNNNSSASLHEKEITSKQNDVKTYLSRGQRRRRKGKERVRKRSKFEKEMLDQIAKERNISAHGKLTGMNSLMSYLPSDSKKTTKSEPKHLTHKQRHRSRVSEIAAMASVLMHPTFKSNPLSAIKQHLEATVALSPTIAEDE